MKIFIDSSVLVSACVSKIGASSFILGYCKNKKLQAYISNDVLGEARKNIYIKLDQIAKERFEHYLKKINFIKVENPQPEIILFCEKNIYKKDAPILAAAIKSPTSHLITLDKKHFLTTKTIEFAKPLEILTPGEFVRRYLRK